MKASNMNMAVKTEISFRTIRMMITSVSDIFVVPVEQLGQVLFHGLLLAFIIMGFWLLDSLKDPIIANFLGLEYQPTAKFFSVLTTLILVCIYDYLTCMLSKPNLFHLVSVIFGMLFMILSALISDPNTGLDNRIKGPDRYVGWLFYFSVEAYGSLVVTMFWSYTNSIMNLEQAKGAYGLIITVAQIGAIIGATLATHTEKIGIPQLILIASVIILCVSLLVKTYQIIFKKKLAIRIRQSILLRSAPTTPLPSQKSATTIRQYIRLLYQFVSGFYEGLVLILSYSYTLKLLALSCIYEIIVTIMDYEFKLRGSLELASGTPLAVPLTTTSTSTTNTASMTSEISSILGDIDHTESHHLVDASTLSKIHTNISTSGSEDQFALLMGHFGQLTNVLSLIISLFGFAVLVKRMGVRFSLLVFPSVLLVAVILTNLFSSLNVLFVVVSILKAMIFSLNEPVKELLYIPTTESIKFKSKAWIDVFGSRLAKAIGSFLTYQSKGDLNRLRTISELPCIILSCSLIGFAWLIGKEFHYNTTHHIIIGADRELDESTSSSLSSSLSIKSDNIHGYPPLLRTVRTGLYCNNSGILAPDYRDTDEQYIYTSTLEPTTITSSSSNVRSYSGKSHSST